MYPVRDLALLRYDKHAVESVVDTRQAQSAGDAMVTPSLQNRRPKGLGWAQIISSAVEATGQTATGVMQYMGMKAQAEAGTNEIKEYMKNKGFLERQARAEFRNQLIASKVKGQESAAAAATEATIRTDSQRKTVYLGIAGFVVIGVAGALFMIARRG